ncbi:MAG: polymerase subunit delta, polymerase subunit delta protein [Parcubacteria group bacterium]|nr:polymerase subunit delta, polymerase subunit delta protein [Parcubacteria group bacterium]
MEIHLHHAYLLEGAPLEGERFLSSMLEGIGFSRKGNPDYAEFNEEAFSVDDARRLRDMAGGKPFGDKKVFAVKTRRFSDGAQNALLKTLEEPILNTHFFLLFEDRELLLPTLLSRLSVVRVGRGEENNKEAEEFLTMNPSQRLLFVKKFIDKEKSLAPFLDSLLLILRAKGSDDIKKVFPLRLYADDPSASGRLILEHLSLALR